MRQSVSSEDYRQFREWQKTCPVRCTFLLWIDPVAQAEGTRGLEGWQALPNPQGQADRVLRSACGHYLEGGDTIGAVFGAA
ncbi:hypothetical protein [Larsenimonas rhizosphaerae]|uniref:Uncharacterized protein n=1 Tax=Larsenimonas rhizosphaerae TaxID=2944682 RepID=A0AA42CV91_9GAMM|nr:hypothetical protein [Larsenimonas rhizosphaerae]MCX2525199.1 hypothetical protein [Larsenimonas rhizosphaerae]